MKTLKMKSFKTSLPLAIIFLVVGIVFAVILFPSAISLLNGPVDLDEVDFDGDIDGLYVKGTIYGIYDCYCEETNGTSASATVVGREYVIDAGAYYYMGLCVDAKDIKKSEALMAASWNYLDGYADYEYLEEYQFEVTGTITRMPSDSLDLYDEYIEWCESTPEEAEIFLPYYLEVGKINDFSTIGFIAFAVLTILFLFLAVLFPVLALTGFYQKEIKKYIAASPNPDMTAARIEHFFQNTPETDGLRYNNEFISGQYGLSHAFGEVSKLAWVYVHTVTQKQYFVTVSKSYSLMLGFADGTRQSVAMKSENAANGHITRLGEQFPQIVSGYTAELDRMFTRDLNGFLTLRYNQNQGCDL